MPNRAGASFIGGPLDGLPTDMASGPWHIEDGHAYLRAEDRWRYVGRECDGCSSIVIPLGEDGQPVDACPLCGTELAAGDPA